MLTEKDKQIIRNIKEDRLRLFDKYEKIGYFISMPIKYIKRREIKEITIFTDNEINECDDDLFIEPIPVEKEEKEIFEFKEEIDIELEKNLEKVHEALKKDEKKKEQKSEKKGWFGKQIGRLKKKKGN